MTVHIGLIGGGNITETHARAALAIPGVEISAIHGTNSEKIAHLCHQHGGTPYQNFAAFLKHRPMDLVIIGSPSGLHAEQGSAAAREGLHVLTEKPIEITTARADVLIRAAEQSGVQLGVIFQDRTKPHIRQLKDWLDQNLLGKVLLVDARVKWYRPPDYYANSRWRGTQALDGGGALINQGVHTVDLLLWLLGDVVRVQARTATLFHKIEAEDTAVATLEFSSGALGAFTAPGLLPGAGWGARVTADFNLLPRLHLLATGLFLPEEPTTGGGFAFGISAFGAGGCFDLVESASFQLAPCASLLAGEIHAVVYSLQPLPPGGRIWGAGQGAARARLQVFSSLFLEADIGLFVPLVRYAFSVVGQNTPVFQETVVVPTAELAMGLSFP